MLQISSPREQVGVNQHGPLRFGREEILMWLPQGSEEADPWSSSLGISHIPQGRGSGVHGGGRGCVLLALPRGNGGGIPGVSCVPLPMSGVPASQRREPAGGSWVALLGLLRGSGHDRQQIRHWGSIKLLHSDPSSTWDRQDLTCHMFTYSFLSAFSTLVWVRTAFLLWPFLFTNSTCLFAVFSKCCSDDYIYIAELQKRGVFLPLKGHTVVGLCGVSSWKENRPSTVSLALHFLPGCSPWAVLKLHSVLAGAE